MELGRVGIWSGHMSRSPATEVRAALREIEELGYTTVWYPESVGKETFATAGVMLSATDGVIAASGIANIWARDATAMIGGARTLAEAYPGRFLLGIGVSHAPSVARRGGDYARPLETMAAYLNAMDAARYSAAAPDPEPPVVLAALGPRMLELAGHRTMGAHPYFASLAHTAFARETLGPDPLLAPEQPVVLARDRDEARFIARDHAARYLALDNYRNNLLRLGWSPRDLDDSGSDELFDAVFAWGGIDDIQQRVADHLDAGADHVCVQVLGGEQDRYPIDQLRQLTPALQSL